MCEISDHIDSLDIEVINGAWHSLCAGILLHTVSRIERNAKINNRKLISDTSANYSYEGEVAERWLDGGRGTVKLEEVCDALELNPDSVRSRCHERADKRKRMPQKDFTRVTRPRLR